MRFEDLRLAEPLLRAVRAAGYHTPTPIQANAIPHALAGRDVLGSAQTGTGKTAAFALPILHRLTEGSPRQAAPKRRIRALILCPTRELAHQIQNSFAEYGAHTGIRTAAIIGGMNQNPQLRAIRAGADVVIATPGRLLDLMGQGHIRLGDVEILVLDEADRMLDMGFLPDIKRIIATMPRERQSLLFSATMPAPIRALADEMLRDPARVQVARTSSAATTVEHWAYHIEPSQKMALLMHLIGGKPDARTLVFTRTKHGADKLTRHLLARGVSAAALHGNKSQAARTRALGEFRSARTPVLVATDVAARGLDVDDIAQVINYDLTPDPETYVHRIGRTGRAGASGMAISFCTAGDRGDLKAIERFLRTPLQRAEVPPLRNAPATPRPRPVQADRPASRTPPMSRRTRTAERSPKQGSSRGRRRGRRNARSAAPA